MLEKGEVDIYFNRYILISIFVSDSMITYVLIVRVIEQVLSTNYLILFLCHGRS